MTVDEIVTELKSGKDEKALAGMARYGINVGKAYGWSVPDVRALGKRIVKESGRKDPSRHDLALDLWETGIHEARLLAAMVDMPESVTEDQMEVWVLDLDSWDVCDQLCNNLFVYTSWAWPKAVEWSERQEEFVKRAGFALMAVLAWHDKQSPDERFLPLLAAIEREAGDGRNFVKKAVNWALRNIGKRNLALNQAALACAERILDAANRRTGGERGGDQAARAARWVATDAIRELGSAKVRARLARRTIPASPATG